LIIAKAKKGAKEDKPEKKTRKKKDANAPKKPMSSFFWYQATRRNILKQEQSHLAHKDLIQVSTKMKYLFYLYSLIHFIFIYQIPKILLFNSAQLIGQA